MSSERDPLLEVATDLVEGREVDWEAEADRNPGDRRVLENLRRIAGLATIFDRIEAPDSPESRLSTASGEPPRSEILFHWGHLKVTEHLGSGNFGDVYQAFDPILQRSVALKLRRDRGDETNAAIGYIDEARRLARVRHPNILAIHGADLHDGRVGLWADLLQGRTLEQEMESGTLFSTTDTVAVALSLAEALAAVHDAGLVHGDVKASNIMLEANETVVLMDFGAGAESGDGFRTASPAGSPLSMAPELFAGNTATQSADLYALGVLIYRLYEGEYPLTAASVEELAEQHRKGQLASAAVSGTRMPRSLNRLVRRLLAPDPAHRPTAADAAGRLRWIRDAPARLRRRLAAGVIAISLITGTAAATVAYFHARRAEARAAAARQDAETVTEFLYEILASPRPSESGRQVTVVELLERAVGRIDAQFVGQPLVEARILDIVGGTYLSLDQYEAAETLLRRSVKLTQSHLGAEHPQTLRPSLKLAWLFFDRGRFEKASSTVSEVQALAAPLGRAHSVNVEALILEARIASEGMDYSAAEALLEQALAQRSGSDWHDDFDRRLAELNLGQLLVLSGNFEAAESLAEPLLQWAEKMLGERHANTIAARRLLAEALAHQGRLAEAEPLMRHNLATAEGWLGPEDQYAVACISDLSNNLAEQGKIHQATRLSRRALEISEKTLGPNHHNTLVTMGNHANRLRELGQVDEAAALLSETISRLEKEYGSTHHLALMNRYNLAELLHLEGRHSAALDIARPARATMAETLGEHHLFTLVTDSLIGAALTSAGRPNEGEQILQRALASMREFLGPTHPQTLQAQVYLARTLRALGQTEEATTLLSEAVLRLREVLGADHPQTSEAEKELRSYDSSTREEPAPQPQPGTTTPPLPDTGPSPL